jgi:integrase
VIADGFAKSLRADDQKPLLRDVTPDAIRRHLGETLKRKSASTVNMERKVLRVFFRRAVANGRIATDPCLAVKGLRADPDARRRRPFTVDEVKTLLGKASGFWRVAVLTGFYTGLRISDIAEMPVGAVDFKEGMIRVKTRKTGTRVAVPIPAALAAVLKARIDELGKPGPDALLWPDYAAQTSGQRSGEFHKLLVAAGLADTRTHRSTGKGRDAAREGSTISFHSLRHSFVSLLKATGSGQTIAKALAGHASDDISDHYTTLPSDVLRNAVAALPDVT